MRFLYIEDSELLWDALTHVTGCNIPVHHIWQVAKALRADGLAYFLNLKIKLEKNGYARIYRVKER